MIFVIVGALLTYVIAFSQLEVCSQVSFLLSVQ